jgi:hypothetical protein
VKLDPDRRSLTSRDLDTGQVRYKYCLLRQR